MILLKLQSVAFEKSR